ncbi:MAG: discoidin domain-containing protein, partial [Phycisphaerae bacterium]|nr:discoidin domain-containing protein [Phycisphaerae bacterium]
MLRRTVWSLSIVVLCALVADQASYGFSPNSDPSLVGLWKLDDGSGTTAVDSSTGGHHGTLMNGPVWVAGQLGGALEFDGTDDYVDTGLTQNLPTWTISVWANSPAAPSGSGLPSGPLHREQNYQINWNHNGGWAGCVGANLGGSWTSASLGTLGANTWYHLCGTYDGTAMKAYTNGELINTTTVPGTPSSETNSMKLGRHAAAAQYYRGLVDDARVYNRALTQEEIRKVMAGGGNPGLASAPDPEAQATDVPRDATLSWTAGAFAGTHDVYFGTRYEDVNTASRTADPAHVLVSQGQADATYDPAGLLEFGQTYAWRVDEVNAAPDGFIHKGDVWGFTVEPYAYPITPIAATASSRVSKTLMGPDQTINGSGMTGDQHGTTVTHMWVSSPSAPDPAWIQYEFDRVYKMHELWVWNSNQATEGTLVNYGAREVAVECSTDGATWTAVADVPEFAQATGRPDYTHNTTVNLDGLLARYVRLTMKSSWS